MVATKKCRLCGQEKPITEFHKRGGNRGDYQAECKTCSAKRFAEGRKHKRRVIARYKRMKGCVECGHKDERAMYLHFHHVVPSTKDNYGDSHAYDANWSWQRIKAELAKCVILCNSCHTKETFANYYQHAA